MKTKKMKWIVKQLLKQERANQRLETALIPPPSVEGTLLSVASFSVIALALGINHSADEGSIIARAKELVSFEGDVLKSTKASTRDDALGAIKALDRAAAAKGAAE